MIEPFWIAKSEVVKIHDEQIELHGGPSGLRDDTLLESALARPRNLFAYEEPDLLAIAASYAFGLARNHAFVDGNKRTSFLVCVTFLAMNGLVLTAGEDEKINTWFALADGAFGEGALAEWLRARVQQST